jgi:hypothetical protein
MITGSGRPVVLKQSRWRNHNPLLSCAVLDCKKRERRVKKSLREREREEMEKGSGRGRRRDDERGPGAEPSLRILLGPAEAHHHHHLKPPSCLRRTPFGSVRPQISNRSLFHGKRRRGRGSIASREDDAISPLATPASSLATIYAADRPVSPLPSPAQVQRRARDTRGRGAPPRTCGAGGSGRR